MPTIGPTEAPTPSTNFLTQPVSIALSNKQESRPPFNLCQLNLTHTFPYLDNTIAEADMLTAAPGPLYSCHMSSLCLYTHTYSQIFPMNRNIYNLKS